MKKKKRATPGAQPVDASDAPPAVAATGASERRGGASTVTKTPEAPKKLGGSKTTKAQRQAAKLAALETAGDSAVGGKRKPLSEAAKLRLEKQRAAQEAARGEEAEEKEGEEADQSAAKRPRREELPWGPPVGVKTMVNDEWQTCKSSWEALVPILGPLYMDKCVWQPFYYDGICCRHLEELGFNSVVHVRADFFKKVEDPAFMQKVDVIWDNPPYTDQVTKEEVLRALVKCGKPFCVLMPISTLHAQFLRDVLDTSKLQVIMPRKVWVRKRRVEPIPFKYLAWLGYNLGLPKDLYLL